MTEFDPSELPDLEQRAEATEAVKLAAVRSQGRDAAVLRGRLLGASEADRRGETGQDRDDRIARAKAYAAWEYDGKPTDGSHMREFGVAQQSDNLVGLSGPDWKKGKK